MIEPAEMIADFYKALIKKEIPKAVAIQLTIGWMTAMFRATVGQNKEKGADAIADWLSKTQGGFGN